MFPAPVECPAWPCSAAALAQTGVLEVAPSFAVIAQGMCQEFDDAGCWTSWPVPQCAVPAPGACVGGQCVDCANDDCSGASCEPCETPEIIWAPTGPTIGDSHTIVDCKTLVTNFADSSPQCSTALPCTSSPSHDVWSFAHIQNLLGDPTVKAALESDRRFVTPGGVGTRVTIGAHAISVGTTCEGAQTCAPLPAAVEQLFALLDSIAIAQSCSRSAMPSAACDLPFDPGTGTGDVSVVAFDSALGTCAPKRYSGTGGNSNRFDTFEGCQASCPMTASADGCASERLFVPDGCLVCGPADACLTPTGACALRCTTNADCTDTGFNTCGTVGTCELAQCP